jgi:hypothetical protein
MTGTTLAAYTLVHVALSLVGIVSGLVVLYGLLTNNGMPSLTKWFLSTTIATSLTGYGFPVEHLLPSHIVGAVSLVVLALALLARYRCQLAGGWRQTYVISAMIGLYLNVFVLVVQSFEKIPALKAVAPTQQEAPFSIAQLGVLVLFIFLTIGAVRKFRGQAGPVRVRRADSAHAA